MLPLLPLLYTYLSIPSTVATPTRPSLKQNDAFSWSATKSVIAFGDSYTFIQGTLGRPNYTFIGDAFNLSFTPTDLFSNRIALNQTATTQGTASGGPNWAEYLTGCGVQKGLTDPQTCDVQLWDFAYAGANTISDPDFTPAHWNHTVSFQQQIEQYVAYGDPALRSIGLDREHALVAVWIGINDINDLARLRGKGADFEPLFEKVQKYVFESVEKVYGLGYRKFLFMNLPPLDRGPSPGVNASLVEMFNDLQAEYADTFQGAHEDAIVLQFDVNTALKGILDEHVVYGFTNVTNFCPGFNQRDIRSNPEKYGCGEGLDTYFWYDSGHLGSRVHKVFTAKLSEWLMEKSC